MLIGVMADTHDNLPLIEQALKELKDRGAALLVHAGDFVAPFALKAVLAGGIPLVGVFGNNDGEREGLMKLHVDLHKEPHRFMAGGRSLVAAHGPEVLWRVLKGGDDVGICGHTHEPLIEPGPPLVVNPGEVGGWLTGRSTAAVIDLATLRAEIVEL